MIEKLEGATNEKAKGRPKRVQPFQVIPFRALAAPCEELRRDSVRMDQARRLFGDLTTGGMARRHRQLDFAEEIKYEEVRYHCCIAITGVVDFFRDAP